ncbi:MAG: hypothetical protein ABIL09_03635, partial [Gemmatimonadota bacterium]
MFDTITITGLGLDETVTLGHQSIVTLRRPSMEGKSRIARAIMLLLTGREPGGSAPYPRQGETIEIVGRSGPVELVRRIRRDDDGALHQQRAASFRTDDVDVSSEKKWQSFFSRLSPPFGRAYADPEAVRLICWPLHWRTLAQQQGGKPLVAALLRALDCSDPSWRTTQITRIVSASPHHRQGEPVRPKELIEARRLANRASDQAAGALREAQATLASLEPIAMPSTSSVERARAILKLAEAWGVYRQWYAADERLKRWEESRQALGTKPATVVPEALETARRARDTAERQRGEAWSAGDAALDLQRQAKRALADAEALLAAMGEEPEVTTTCPECGQEWEQAEERSKRRQKEWRAELARRRDEVEARRATLTEASEAIDEARATTKEREAAHDEALLEYRGLESMRVESMRWERDEAMLGPRPSVPEAVDQPSGPEPRDSEVS